MNKENRKGFFIRTVTLIAGSMNTIHTFIFGKVFGGAVRPWCELFGLSDWVLELNASDNEDFSLPGFTFVVFFVDGALGSLNTISVTMKHISILKDRKKMRIIRPTKPIIPFINMYLTMTRKTNEEVMRHHHHAGWKLQFMEQCMNLPLCVWGTIYYHKILSCCKQNAGQN